jgi:hypothetical protein
VIIVNHNGSKFAGDPPDDLDTLRARLRAEPLDPKFEKYGDFVLDLAGDKIPGDRVAPAGTVRFWGNFYDLSAGFSIDTDEPATIAEFTALERATQATPAYQAARVETLAEDVRREERFMSHGFRGGR